jgi:hypothetical protein
MPSEPHCTICMDERAVGGITYRRVSADSWDVVWEGRPTDTTVMFTPHMGEVAWLVFELRSLDGLGSGAVDVYGYERLTDFERAYIARDGRERNGGEDASPPSDNRGDAFPL